MIRSSTPAKVSLRKVGKISQPAEETKYREATSAFSARTLIQWWQQTRSNWKERQTSVQLNQSLSR